MIKAQRNGHTAITLWPGKQAANHRIRYEHSGNFMKIANGERLDVGEVEISTVLIKKI